MKLLLLASAALLPISLIAGPKEIRASSVQWEEHFGSCNAEPHTSFCLMARGFFRSPTKNVQAVTSAWLKKHPNAKLIRVSSMPASTKDPQALLTFVWVVDGDESLNLELVRQGCFDPGTQTLGAEQRLEVRQGDYDAFTKKLTIAGEYAHQHNLGIWSEPAEPDVPND
jgi:hypothetical protein